jgi:cell division protein FtsB
MRFGEFKLGPAKPIGEGKEKKVFVNPENPERVIAEIKKPKEAEFKMDTPLDYSPRQLKGAFYLTKIAHLLLPKNVPEIYQVGETKEGQQTIDSERIDNSPQDISGAEFVTLKEALEKIGLEFIAEEHRNLSNYSKGEDGNAKYTETLMPWRVGKFGARHRVELSFDEKDLTKAIKKLKDSKEGPIRGANEEAASYLERIKELYDEEVQAYTQFDQENLKDPEEGIKEVEALFTAYPQKHNIELLFSITDLDVALASEERIAAKKDLLAAWAQMQKLRDETKITTEQYDQLNNKYKELNRSLGLARGKVIDHS